jgi:hypothetical protein
MLRLREHRADDLIVVAHRKERLPTAASLVASSAAAGANHEASVPSFDLLERPWLAPSPTASIEITAETPKSIPSIVRSERSLCSRRLLIPRRSVRNHSRSPAPDLL